MIREACDAYMPPKNDVEWTRFDRESCLFIYYAIELGSVHAYFGNELSRSSGDAHHFAQFRLSQ